MVIIIIKIIILRLIMKIIPMKIIIIIKLLTAKKKIMKL